MSQPTITREQANSALPSAASATAALTPGQRLRTVAPTLLVIAALGGLAFWGHATDWTLPKFSALFGGKSGQTAGEGEEGADGWCKEHNVPEAICIECNTKLVPAETDFGWCSVHGISQCPLDHPEVAQLKAIPMVSADAIERANRALALMPRTENNIRCIHYQRRIQFASAEAIEKAGIDIAIAQEGAVVEAISANGEIIYDQTKLAHLTSRVGGTVWKVEKFAGNEVKRGEILAIIDAADVGHAKSEFMQSISQLRKAEGVVERLAPLSKDGAIAGKSLREAEAALAEAQIKLLGAQQTLINLGLPVNAQEFAGLDTQRIAKEIQFLGLPADMTASFEPGTTTSNLLAIRSPLDGVIVQCEAVPGEVIQADAPKTLFTVTDLRRMWLMLDVRQDDASFLSLGQKVLFKSSDSKTKTDASGTISWISTEVDDKTRTVKVRVDLPNTDHRLRANTFGTGRIVLREEPRAIMIPTEAVHTDGDCAIVFVRDKNFFKPDAPKFFHVREVRLGAREGDNTEIIAGVLPGEILASKNSMVLEAQLLKSNLGEGCACCAPVKKSEPEKKEKK
jgi:cobalt-zinc-cadmium efflux system membrane fusion protein